MATYQLDAAFKLLEHDIYGSSCMCLDKTGYNYSITPPVASSVYNRILGKRQYEAGNHLGNVLATVSDYKKPNDVNADALVDFYNPQVISSQDYYPFGAPMKERTFSSAGYRYGFNGKENDNEVKGNGNQQDYGMRIYDPRLGRFLSVDPIAKDYPELTPYQFASNRPIDGIDLDGLEYATFSILIYKNKVAAIKVQTDYDLKSKTTKGPGIQYNYLTINSDGKTIGVPKIDFIPNMYGIYQGSDNPSLPDIGGDPNKKHWDYTLKPIDKEDADALVHDLSYDKLYPKLEGFSGVMSPPSSPANKIASKASFKNMGNYLIGNTDEVSKKPITGASFICAVKMGFGFAFAERGKHPINTALKFSNFMSEASKYINDIKDKTAAGISSLDNWVPK
jgi:RHS repeat-associated protein